MLNECYVQIHLNVQKKFNSLLQSRVIKGFWGLDQPCKTVRLEVKDNSSNDKTEKQDGDEERKDVQYLEGFCN